MDGFGCFIHRGDINLTRERNGTKLGLLAGKAKLGLLVGCKACLLVRQEGRQCLDTLVAKVGLLPLGELLPR